MPPAAFKDIPGKKDFPGKHSVRSCVFALTFSIGHQGRDCQPPCSPSLLCLLQCQSLVSTGLCIQRDECGDSACTTWEPQLVLWLSDWIVRTLFLTLLRSLLGQYSSTVPRKNSQSLKFFEGGFRNSSSLGKKNLFLQISFPRPSAWGSEGWKATSSEINREDKGCCKERCGEMSKIFCMEQSVELEFMASGNEQLQGQVKVRGDEWWVACPSKSNVPWGMWRDRWDADWGLV